MRATRFFDPLYGRTEFSGRDTELILLPEIQRLRYVRMCNINSLLISGASEVSRFEHVVGVLHLAKIWTETNRITGTDADVFHAAALLHDVQTGPFGHSMEYILADNQITDDKGEFRHNDVKHGSERMYLQRAEAAASFMGFRFRAQDVLGPLWDRVAEAIIGQGPHGSLIAGRIDLDNIDNVVRLAYHAGVAERGDGLVAEGLARDIQVIGSALSISRAGAELLVRWQEIRRDLYLLLLHDWAEFSAKAMLTTMLELGVAYDLVGADSWSLTDDQLLFRLTNDAVGDAQSVAEMGRRLMTGDLYAPLGLWRTTDVDAYPVLSSAPEKRKIEQDLSNVLRTKIIFHVIRDKGKTQRELSLILREDGKTHRFGQDTDEVLVGVFFSRGDFSDPIRKRAEERLRQLLTLRGVSNLTELEDPVGETSRASDPSRQLELL